MYAQEWTVGPHGNSIISFSFDEISILFSIVAVPNYIPANSVGGVPLLYTLISQSLFCEWSLYSDREDNGTPLQYSCLENPMDEGAG